MGWFTKLLLNFGLCEADYINECVGEGYQGEVTFWIPKMKSVGCGGNTKFTGIVKSSSAEAHNAAPAKALVFLQLKLKLTIVDKNYAWKLEKEAENRLLVYLLEKFLHVADKVKQQLSVMMDCINCAADIYGGHSTSFLAGKTDAQVIAFKFCAKGIEALKAAAAAEHDVAAAKLKDLE
uniref:Uncharacterized protein n=1 Tax=Arundo donax TaxID=35708 RepID=A0A0A9E601_ARUDO